MHSCQSFKISVDLFQMFKVFNGRLSAKSEIEVISKSVEQCFKRGQVVSAQTIYSEVN